MFYRWAKILVRLFLRFYHRVEVTGMKEIPRDGSVILVGNHISNLDPFYIGAVFPRKIRYMAKEEAFRHPVFRWFLHLLDAFPVNRGKPDIRALKTALSTLENRQVVGIFPEGGRREDRPMQELKHGASYLAMRSGTPVLPVYIEGTDRALPRGGRWIRPVKIHLRFGRLIHPPSVKNLKAQQEQLSQEILIALRRLADGQPPVEIRTGSSYNESKKRGG